MKRYVKVERNAAGKTTATVTLVDGELTSKYTSGTYLGGIADAIGQADRYARRQMESMKRALDELEATGVAA